MTEFSQWPASSAELESSLSETVFIDATRLRKLWRAAERRAATGAPADQLKGKFLAELKSATETYQAKLRLIPPVNYPESLPITARREEIAELIQKHQVVILAGETGSGKTTQLPKICLQLGRGRRALIGHTQPRRIAATTVAARIAEELGQPVGVTVGFQVRFTDKTEPVSAIKLMTDGILLAEIQNDPLLLRYDTLIIDEAHERSLNVDFLLGYLKRILPKRPDLKIIVTSATIDLEKFAAHFDNAPVIEVSGRTFPVEIVYRPWDGEYDDQYQAIVDGVADILTMPHRQAGDILVFLAGEREIREAAHAIRRAQFPHLEILPLYARLSLAEQQKVFQGHRGRRVILATNVAETSITVPGIGFVIDPGYARISRYSVRTQVQRLPVEPVSQASANQRAGRCGRVANGLCIRLYSEDDFGQRPAYTDAEILRTNLASVVLKMLTMRAGDIEEFPFIDAPDRKMIRDGYKLLEELQAVTLTGDLTDIGRRLAALPLDPRLARMVIEAEKLGCVKEILIIAAALTIQDPRERPAEKQQAADEKHRRFKHEESDFLAYLSLWDYVEQQRQELSQSQWRKQAGREFLSFMRLREWRDLHHQLRLAIKHSSVKENQEPASYDAIHQALLSGLLNNVGAKAEESKEWEYDGTHNRKFAIFPGSSQSKKKPKWLVAAQLLETSRLFAHCVARVDPQWVLSLGTHLVKHHYYQPHYQKKSGQVVCFDRITLYGLQLSDKERVNYARINPAESREIFIRSALVEGDYPAAARLKPGAFFSWNRQQINEVEQLEAKTRRSDILVDDQVIFDFYDSVIPQQIVNLAGFESWRKQAERSDPEILHFPPGLLLQRTANDITEAKFPRYLEIEGMQLPLTYHFEPGHPDDGVSLGVPASVLHTLPKHRLEWLVPGFLREKCIALMKSLPKHWRKKFVPIPQYVDRILSRLKADNKPLLEAIAQELSREIGENVSTQDWPQAELDDFYLLNIQVLDDRGKVIDRGRNMEILQLRYKDHVRQSLQTAGADMEKENITQWNFGVLQESCNLKRGSVNVRAFPALVKEINGLAIRMLDNPQDAHLKTREGLVALAAQQMSQSVRYLGKSLLRNRDMALSVIALGTRQQVVDDIIFAAINQACFASGELPRTEQQFNQALEQGAARIVELAQNIEVVLLDVLAQVVQIRKSIKTSKNALLLATAVADINAQLDQLLYPGFLQLTPADWFEQYPRYLKAIAIRIEKAPQNILRDKAHTGVLGSLWARHKDRLEAEGRTAYLLDEQWQTYRWMLEELRVSLFAQPLRTRMPVSEKRLQKYWKENVQRQSF